MDLGHLLVAGGGSGGHVFPALAVADEMLGRGWQVSWMGRSEGMEKKLVEKRGLAYHGLPAAAVVGRGPVAKLAALTTAAGSALRARGLIRRQRVTAVLGTGGYASAPGVIGAALARRPRILLEPNAVPGVANAWLSRFADAAAVGNRSAADRLRCAAVETGVPVRSAFFGPHPPLDFGGRLRLLVLGGSQGARQLNRLIPAALAELPADLTGLSVTHQVGAEMLAEATERYQEVDLPGIEVSLVPFVEDVAGAMAASHLVLSRAGAITLAELCAVGRAALLLPLGLAGSHQVANAQELVAGGGAVALVPEEVSTATLANELAELLSDRERLRDMGEASRRLARPNAAQEIANLIEGKVRGR